MRDVSAKPSSIGGPRPSRSAQGAAVLVHVYTAAGAVLAFVGARAVARRDERLALGMMFIATMIDATDGALARRARVKETLPFIDGARIDDLVDYITFVFLPMLLLDAMGGLPPGLSLVVVAVVLLSSAFGFAAADAKSIDYFFTGFPSYWNIVVLYLLALRVPPAANAVILLVLSALIFVRTAYVYPTRTPVLRRLTLALGTGWALVVGVIIGMWPNAPRAAVIASLAFPVYYLVLSVVLDVRRRLVPLT